MQNPVARKIVHPLSIIASLTWLFVHGYVSYALLGSPFGGLKAQIPLFLYGAASWLIAIVICAVGVRRRASSSGLMPAALLWFVGPLLTLVYLEVKADKRRDDFAAAVADVERLCASRGGDKIYRTVDNVEGVFQINARDPDYDRALRDPLAEDPWGREQGDSDQMSGFVYFGGYLFFEQQPGYKRSGPPYRRTYLQLKDNSSKPAGDDLASDGHPKRTKVERLVPRLRSRYGYYVEDLTTPEMRSKWIGGGTLRIVDLATNEVLAERTGFYRGAGANVLLRWAGVGPASSDKGCNYGMALDDFLFSVLRPVAEFPSSEQFQSIAKD